MDGRLTFRYDKVGDILYVDTCPPFCPRMRGASAASSPAMGCTPSPDRGPISAGCWAEGGGDRYCPADQGRTGVSWGNWPCESQSSMSGSDRAWLR